MHEIRLEIVAQGVRATELGLFATGILKCDKILTLKITLRCLEVGEEVASKPFPVGRDVPNSISSFYLRENSVESLYHRFEFCLQFASGGGRTGDIALASTNGVLLGPYTAGFHPKLEPGKVAPSRHLR